MALQQDSDGRWITSDGQYLVRLLHAKQVGTSKEPLWRFSYNPTPTSETEVIETDTGFAYIPSSVSDVFFTNGWARTLRDDEASELKQGFAERDLKIAEENKRKADAEAKAVESAKKNAAKNGNDS